MPSLAGKRALVKVTGAAVAFIGESCSTIDDQIYQVDNAAKRIWDPAAAVTVKVAGVVTGESYTLDRLAGRVLFANVNALRGAVTVGGQYLPAAVAAGVRGYTWTLQSTNLDDTDFDSANTSGGFVSRIQGQLDFSGSLNGRLKTDTYFGDALQAGDSVVLEFYADRSADPDLIGRALLSKRGIQAAVDGTQDQDIEFQGTGDADGRVVSVA